MSSSNNTQFLGQIIETLYSEFPDNWINYKEFKDSNERSFFLIEKFQIDDTIFTLIDSSILTGEYMMLSKSKLDELFDKIKNLLKRILNFSLNDNAPDKDQSSEYFFQIDTGFVKPLIGIINRYALLVDFVERVLKLENSNSILFEKHNEEILNLSDNYIAPDINYKTNVTYYNCKYQTN
jgi:hypothetical protein